MEEQIYVFCYFQEYEYSVKVLFKRKLVFDCIAQNIRFAQFTHFIRLVTLGSYFFYFQRHIGGE